MLQQLVRVDHYRKQKIQFLPVNFTDVIELEELEGIAWVDKSPLALATTILSPVPAKLGEDIGELIELFPNHPQNLPLQFYLSKYLGLN